MDQGSNAPVSSGPVASGGGNERVFAIISIAAGVLSLCGFVLWFIGIPLGIVGIVLGYFGRRDASQKTLATVGMALGVVGILISCLPIATIAMMRLLGPKIGDTFSSINSSLP
jgi:uncharacterized membrane protein